MDNSTGRLVSLQAGKIQTHSNALMSDSPDTKWTSAIVKTPLEGRVWVGGMNLEGDEQANRKHHGGIDKAILAYSAEHYTLWKSEFPDKNWCFGGFGENFTVSGFDEQTICIGDTFTVGEAILQVSEPRQPCHKLAWLWQMKDLPKIVQENNRTGWYMRVLQEGYVEKGQTIVRLKHPYPEWNISTVNYILFHIGDDFDRAERLFECGLLGEKIRKFIREAIDTHRPSTSSGTWKSWANAILKRIKL